MSDTPLTNEMVARHGGFDTCVIRGMESMAWLCYDLERTLRLLVNKYGSDDNPDWLAARKLLEG